jgi:glycerophosphoryl diester phosphodiesterase
MTKFIAHRGFAHEEKQNTVAAFQCASDSSAYGIETDVRITKDGIFVAFHDKSAARLSGKYKIIEKTDFKDVQKLKVYDRQRRHRVPTIMDFLQNCKLSNKIAIVEIKSCLTNDQTEKLIQIIDLEQYLRKTVFISFNVQVLICIRTLLPEQSIQMLAHKYKDDDLDLLQGNRFGIDINHRHLTQDRINEYHSRGIEVNCWTVNSSRRSKLLQQWGVDFITTDKLTLSEMD